VKISALRKYFLTHGFVGQHGRVWILRAQQIFECLFFLRLAVFNTWLVWMQQWKLLSDSVSTKQAGCKTFEHFYHCRFFTFLDNNFF